MPRYDTAGGKSDRVRDRLRIPLILISHSGRSRSPIPVILITLFTMPEEGTADSMTWRGQLPLTVEQVSFLPGGRQAFDRGKRLTFSQALALQLDPMRSMNDTIQDRISQSWIAEYFMMP
jgi:hypothetical protein